MTKKHKKYNLNAVLVNNWSHSPMTVTALKLPKLGRKKATVARVGSLARCVWFEKLHTVILQICSFLIPCRFPFWHFISGMIKFAFCFFILIFGKLSSCSSWHATQRNRHLELDTHGYGGRRQSNEIQCLTPQQLFMSMKRF